MMQYLPAITPAHGDSIAHLLDTVQCVDAFDLLDALPDSSIDLIVTSPPYADFRNYNGYEWDFKLIAAESYRVLKPGGVLFWNTGDKLNNGTLTLIPFRQALYFVDNVGFNLHQRIIWQKKGLPQKRPSAYYDDFEDCFILSKGTPKTFNPVMRKTAKAGETRRKGHNGKNGFEYQKGQRTVASEAIDYNVWLIAVGGNKTATDNYAYEHPAPFPEKLAERAISTYTNPGDTVIDYFMGSGTTAKMAKKLKRKYIGCDISFEYVTLCRERLQQTDPMQDSLPDEDGFIQQSLFGLTGWI